MNEILEKILTRRSIRSYIEEQIPEEKLDAILKAATHAPSGSNSQSWLFTAKIKLCHNSTYGGCTELTPSTVK